MAKWRNGLLSLKPRANNQRAVPASPSVWTSSPEDPPPSGATAATRSPRYWLVAAAAILMVVLLTWLFGTRHRQSASASASEQSPDSSRTARVERRDFIRTVRLGGTVEAIHATTVAAPRLAGQTVGSLVITHLIRSGTAVKRGDLLVEFDRQAQIKAAFDKQAEYRDYVEQINKMQAEQAAARARDDTELKQADDAMQSAELETKRNEVVSRIDAEKNLQALDEARATLKQLRATYDLKRRAAEADLRVLVIQRDRAHAAMLHAQNNSEKMAVHAELDGLVVFNPIWKGGQMGDVQEGDEVRTGVPFMQVVDPASMQVRVAVNQADIAYLREAQPVTIKLDAYPDLLLPGKLGQAAAIGVTSGLSSKVHTFSSLFQITGNDPRLLPDLSAAVDVELERRAGVLVIPRDALFSGGGQSYVRVQTASGFQTRAIKIGPTSDTDVVIESGIDAGAVVLRGSVSDASNGAAKQ
ncbi:MAG TPA: HlyD family efflux transporter periplasmic adaptor subunit [Candidatus Dormibacteraeota bacterium]|nr:HlyD family efflux transporter periplasmic adaptor subunit [Candidatus Dormibacteraeota bacterium]